MKQIIRKFRNYQQYEFIKKMIKESNGGWSEEGGGGELWGETFNQN